MKEEGNKSQLISKRKKNPRATGRKKNKCSIIDAKFLVKLAVIPRIGQCLISRSVQRRKWFPIANNLQTGNDSQTGPQMIPNRKWFPMWTADLRRKTRNGLEFSFLDFFIFFIFIFIHFHQQNDELDKHKEKIFRRR